MKNRLILILSPLLIFALILSVPLMSFKDTAAFEPIAVIELFTSQGCSSCPPADRLLSQTIAEAKKDGKRIFALSFHVDYWNYLGWKDSFSDRKYSERQDNYVSKMQLNSAYTPQMIVNGGTQFVGSDERELKNALSKSLVSKSTAGFKMLTAKIQNGNAPTVKYELEGDFPGCKVNFALVSIKETTSVRSGENKGRTLLSENVVRQFVTIPAKSLGEINFDNVPSLLSANGNSAIIGYIQRSDLRIIGAAMTELK